MDGDGEDDADNCMYDNGATAGDADDECGYGDTGSDMVDEYYDDASDHWYGGMIADVVYDNDDDSVAGGAYDDIVDGVVCCYIAGVDDNLDIVTGVDDDGCGGDDSRGKR